MSETSHGLPTKAQFMEQVEKTVQSRLADGRSIELTLVAVNEYVSTPTQQNFSVVLKGPIDMPAEQGIYSLENEALGEFDLFLVPIGKDSEGLILEAVFNQLFHADADARSAKV